MFNNRVRHVALLQLEEPLLLLGREKFMGVDIRVRVKGGGHVSQIYGECTGGFWCLIAFFLTILSVAIRQAVSKSLIAYYQKCKLVCDSCRDIHMYSPLHVLTPFIDLYPYS